MKEKDKNVLISVIILLIGAVMLYFGNTLTLCLGWNIINPLCWASSFVTHVLLTLGGVALLIAGIIRLIFK